MKRIDRFAAFEKASPALIEKACDAYEDIRSIGYILEEEGIAPEHRIKVVCVPEGSLQKEIRTILIRKPEEIRGFLNRPTFELRELMVLIEAPDRMAGRAKEDEFDEIVDRYFAFFLEHMDYIDRSHISKRAWWSRRKRWEICVSAAVIDRMAP